MLQQVAGVSPTRSVEAVSAVAAPESVALALRVAPGTPVLLRRRVTFGPADRVMEVNFNWCRSDRYTLELELRAGV